MTVHRRAVVHFALFIAILGQSARGQDFCTVTSSTQLQQLLNCLADCGSGPCSVPGCSNICGHRHIVIPANTTVQFNSTIELNAAHQGLRLTVNGTLQWSGSAGTGYNNLPILIRFTGHAQNDLNITLDGTGTIRTPFVPCQNWNGQQQQCVTPAGGEFFIAEGLVFRIDARNVTVKDLKIENTFMAIKVDYTSSHLTFQNLRVDKNTLYGIYNDGNNVTIQDCTFNGAYHGFGVGNHGSNTRILNCSVTNAGGGFHVRGGSNVAIHGFQSLGQWCTVGPDPGIPVPEFRVNCVDIRNLTITGEQPNHQLTIEQGTSNVWIENVTTQISSTLSIGRNPSPFLTNRPLNGVWWKNLSGTVFVHNNPCIGSDVGPRACRADITRDGTVRVPDLLAVIGAWGGCAATMVCDQELDYCPASVPGVSCTTVGVPDLLAIISSWGPCGP